MWAALWIDGPAFKENMSFSTFVYCTVLYCMLELNLKDKTGVNVPSVRVLHSKSNQIKTQADSPVITNHPFTVKWMLVLFESSAVDLNLSKIIERGKKNQSGDLKHGVDYYNTVYCHSARWISGILQWCFEHSEMTFVKPRVIAALLGWKAHKEDIWNASCCVRIKPFIFLLRVEDLEALLRAVDSRLLW